MAATEDEVIIIDGLDGFVIEEDEEATMNVVAVYEAYANTIGALSGEIEVWHKEAERALAGGDPDALLNSSINVRLAMASIQGASMMMELMGLNPEIRLDVEVSEDAEG